MTSENAQGPGSADLAAVAAALRDVTASLDRHIAQRAEQLAQPRIAAAEQVAAARIADLQAAAATERQRAADLVAELRRQLDAAHGRLTAMAWLVRYLPWRLRALVLPPDASEARHPYPRPDERFVDAAAAAANDAGLAPYADHGAESRTGAAR